LLLLTSGKWLLKWFCVITHIISPRSRNKPQDDDEAIKQVESVLNVAEEAVSDHLEQHLDGEQRTEEQIAVLEHHCQRHRLSTFASATSPAQPEYKYNTVFASLYRDYDRPFYVAELRPLFLCSFLHFP